ncbi:uncharacterized protein BKA55DRAFT_596340 [Fusarium redolens]|uniref:Uncharacterized protein n=1 Tax=Fusarium redolens TaxID=48865 RepID=A0A9P9GL49_FUSRE|nr:uncharacterized protein BKA55DRAFT_596340 [Fusarium redolens]KAH7240966.1 hypothetical protein BKA55DRAFT_596340 [Fusarium redolens]
MPHRSVFDRFQGALERVTRRHGRERDRGSRSPQRYAEIVAAPDHGPDRAGHFHRGASLPDLLTHVTLGGSAQPLPPDRQSLWDTPAPTPSPVQSQPNASMGDTSHEDQHFIPTAIITTRDTGSIDEGIEDHPWMILGQDFFPENQPQVPSHLRTGLLLSSQLKQRKLELCDCCSPKTLGGDWRALILDSLTRTFTRHESLASCSELRYRTHLKLGAPAANKHCRAQGDVFALLLEILTSPSGLVGHEDGLHLPLLLATFTIDRYIPFRMFHHNPLINSPRLEFEYYEFRSEEIYRAWLAVFHDERLRDYLSPSAVVTLYIHLAPHWWWHDWAHIECDPRSQFEQVFQSFFNRTRLGLHSWMESTAVSVGKRSSVTRAGPHERTLHSSGNQSDGAPTLYGVPFQGTRKAPHQKHPLELDGSGDDLGETLRGFQGSPRQWALDAHSSGAPWGSDNNRTPGTQDVPFTGALEAVHVSPHQWALDAHSTGAAGEMLDESVQDGSDINQTRGDQDVPFIVPPVAVSDMSGSPEPVLPRVD